MPHHHPTIEPLEARIAPAILNAAGTLLTYQDIDGDLVHVAFSHAKMAKTDFSFSTGGVTGDVNTPQALNFINLYHKTGAGFTLTATPYHGKGDSHANVEEIYGLNTDLGTISVDGDVVEFSCGTGTALTLGVKSFTALSLGRNDTAVYHEAANLKNVGSFTVKNDVVNEVLDFTGGVKSLSIGGNLLETGPSAKAGLHLTGNVGSIKIGGSIVAFSGGDQNILQSGGTVGTISIGGSVLGGSQLIPGGAGQIEIDGTLGTLSIGHDLRGGSGEAGGSLELQDVGKITIGGSVIGNNDASDSGYLFIRGNAGSISIGHNIIGGDATGSNNAAYNADFDIRGSLGSFTLGGDFIGGRVEGSGSLYSSDVIGVAGTLGPVSIGGSILGQGGQPIYISVGARGTTGTVQAIKSINVKGSVQGARIVTGHDYPLGNVYNTDSGIGSVTVGGSFIGSNIAVGFTNGADALPGTDDDQGASNSAIIGSVKIGGAFTGVAGDAKYYYIDAPHVKSFQVGRTSYTEAQIDHLSSLVFNSIGTAEVVSFG